MTILKQISGATNHEELKEAGKRLFAAKLSKEKRTAYVQAYKAKRRELDRILADTTSNSTVKRTLFAINTMKNETAAGIAKIGKSLYDSVKAGIVSGKEADLLFRAYRFQKSKIQTAQGAAAQAA